MKTIVSNEKMYIEGYFGDSHNLKIQLIEFMVSTRSQLADSSQAAPESGPLSEEPVMVQPCGGDSVTVGTGKIRTLIKLYR